MNDLQSRIFKTAASSNDQTALDELASSTNPLVRELVATNKNTKSTTLDGMANDSEEGVRGAVAMNENTMTTTLIRLSTDSSLFVKTCVTISLRRRRNYSIIEKNAVA